LNLTGGYNQEQPDNREAAQGNDESCLSILNNFYNDGLKWVRWIYFEFKAFLIEFMFFFLQIFANPKHDVGKFYQ
jgi:methylase of polypeptide subunit release factors